MEMFEKVEKLRERANVSFEEAKEALEACEGDLLDAMVYLEKQGKAKQPEQSTYSTSYEEQAQFVSVKETVDSQKKHQKSEDNVFHVLRRIIRKFINKCKGNYFCAKKNDEVKFKMPVLPFIILTLVFWKVVVPVMLILLFCGFHYSFYGKDELKEVNNIMNKASDLAEQVKENFAKSEEEVAEEDVVDNE